MIKIITPFDPNFLPPNGMNGLATTLALPFYLTLDSGGFQIRDTLTHTVVSDPAHLTFADCRFWAGQRLIFVNNTTTQTATVQLYASIDTLNWDLIGTAKTANGGGRTWLDQSSISQLNYCYPFLSLAVSFSVAPTSGAVALAYMLRSQ